ncbi:MAG: ABC transporter permease [Rhizobacter sp.]
MSQSTPVSSTTPSIEPQAQHSLKVFMMSDTFTPDVQAQTSPWRRVWQRFRANRTGMVCLVIFLSLYGISLCAELLANDRPLLIVHQQRVLLPLFNDYSEADIGGELPIAADYGDPAVRALLSRPGTFALYPLYPFHHTTLNYFTDGDHHPGEPTRRNWLGTDTAGYDVAALLLYGFRISVTFALALTLAGTALGVVIGAVQGYFAGKVDLVTQRLIEVWGAMPELYLLIVFASMFEASFLLLFVLLSLFGWVHLSDYVRAEFLRNRQLEYVKAARALGLSSWQIMWRHLLPNSLTPVITFLPFRMSAAITALASLDFLGLGVGGDTPSLGRLLQQGKSNLDAWWISVAAFGALMVTMLLLTFMGDALRNALDNRQGEPAALDTHPTAVPVEAPARLAPVSTP